MTVSLPVVLSSGLLDGLNPCAFSVLLSFIAIVLGTVAVGEARPQLWRIGGIYVAGMFVTYLLLGLGLISAIGWVVRFHLVVRVMGLAVVALGLWSIKDVLLPGVGPALGMPAAWREPVARALRNTTPVGVLAAGVLVGLCTLPCSGSIYLGVLALLAKAPLATRLPYLVLYNLMYVAPLLAILAAVGNRRTLNQISHWFIHRRHLSKALVGGVSVALGFAILVTA